MDPDTPRARPGRRPRLRAIAVPLALALLWSGTAALPSTGAALTATTQSPAQFTAAP